MKTIANTKKKLSLNVQTLRTLSGSALDGAVGGRGFGIVSTDTPSRCFRCAPRPPFNPSLVGNCPATIKG
jgi:hypothetical protein